MSKLKDLIPDEKNFNKHTEYGTSLLEKSLRKFGGGRSILIDKNNKIIAGNGITETAGAIGLDDVQIVESDGTKIIAVKRTDIDLDTKHGREMALADNASGKANLNFDEALIEETLSEEVMLEWGIGTPKAEEDDYEAPPLEEIKTEIVKGDLFEITNGKLTHRLLCGDSTNPDDVERLMDGEKADMVFTDPPYSVSYEKKLENLSEHGHGNSRASSKIKNDELSTKEIAETIWKPSFINLFKSSKEDCSFYMTMCQGGDQMMMMMMMMENAGWKIKHELIWVKSSPVFSMGRLDYDYKHEPIIYGWKKKHHFYGRGQFTKSVWEIEKPSKSELHPTMKPIALMANAILNSSKENDLIIDLFGGSGSTLIASHELDRNCFLNELDERYCQIILDRILKLDPSLKVLKNGEEYVSREIEQIA